MTELILVAAGGLAREVIEATKRAGRDTVIGVLDDNASLAGTHLAGVPILGGLDTAVPDGIGLVICAGQGSTRESMVRRLEARGVDADRYGIVVDPSAVIGTSCRIGLGSIVLAHVVLTADVEVGRHVVVMPNATLTHDDQLGDFATVCAGVSLGGSVLVESEAYLGMNCSVRQGIRVGRRAVIGMGAVVIREVLPGSTVVGNPASATVVVDPTTQPTLQRMGVG